MNIRSASFRDLGQIEQLHRIAAGREEDGHHSAPGIAADDSPVPQTTLVRLWYGVSKTLSALVPSDPGTALLVAEDGEGGVAGFIEAQSVPGQPKAWHVTSFCLSPTARGHFAGDPLLEELCSQGVEHGVSRFVVRVPLGHPLLSLFVEKGFTQYATEQILFRDDGGSPRLTQPDGVLRPARRDDVGAIHLLYMRTTPSHVANVEGPTQKAWAAAFQGGAMTRVGRDDMRHLVCERSGIVAWAGVRPATHVRPALLSLMVDGQDAALRDEVVDAALAHIAPGPVSCVLRHYDSELIRALQRRDFEVFGSQLLLVRDLAVRVRVRQTLREKAKPVLHHAGVGAHFEVLAPVPVHATPPRRPPTVSQRSAPSSSPR